MTSDGWTRGPNARDRLLDVADRLMWERGYEAVGVAELCAEAGAPRGSFYHWWPSKQTLVLTVIERSWERTRQLLFEPVFDRDAPFGEQLDDYVGRLTAHQQRTKRATASVTGCRYGNFAAELATRDGEVRAALEAVFVDCLTAVHAHRVCARPRHRSGWARHGRDQHRARPSRTSPSATHAALRVPTRPSPRPPRRPSVPAPRPRRRIRVAAPHRRARARRLRRDDHRRGRHTARVCAATPA